MSTFYASFPDWRRAQMALRDILSAGGRADDLSLVVLEGNALVEIQEDEPAAMEDASFIVGRPDDPRSVPGLAEEDSGAPQTFLRESPVGGGISTSEPDDAVDTIDQSDDSQSLAEDTLHPDQGRSAASHEYDDLDSAVRSGFPTSVPKIDDVESLLPPEESDLGLPLERMRLGPAGFVAGGGSLATAALDLANGEVSMTPIRDHLLSEGVSSEVAEELIQALEYGGAVIAVDIEPSDRTATLVQSIAERHGAEASGAFGAPRY